MVATAGGMQALLTFAIFNGTSVSFNLAFMPVAYKVGQKVKKFILRF